MQIFMHEGIIECDVSVCVCVLKHDGCVKDTPVRSVGNLKTAGGCVILVSLEPGG